jgi:hypothetical protein
MYAQASLEESQSGDNTPIAVHKGAITAQVSRLFGALFDQNAPRFSVSWIVDLLVYLDDLGDIGHGYHLPRESRIVRLAQGWGRIAGGLPLDSSEHSEGGISRVQSGMVGRLVQLADNFAPHDSGTEYSRVFDWLTRRYEEIFWDMCEELPEESANRPPEDTTEYYNARFQNARTRGDRWQKRFPNDLFVVARARSLPTHYYVYVQKRTRSGREWIAVTHEQAREWVLLAEKLAGVTNRICVDASSNYTSFLLPDMLPKAWTAAIFACCSTVVPGEKCWAVEIQREGRDVLELLLRGANIRLI